MSTELHETVDALVAHTAAALQSEEMALLPFYGEIYAEVVNLAAGPDFNFVFCWGPILEPHERIVVEVLVYLAREQARQNAHAGMRVGAREDVPVEVFIEKVPSRLDSAANGRYIRYSLTQLTNLDRKKVYAALKSDRLRPFFLREPSPRIHNNGRVVTTPSRFRVRVDPVPTPEQDATIRSLCATRLVQQKLGVSPLMSLSETSVVSHGDTSVTAPSETSGHAQLTSHIGTSENPDPSTIVVSQTETPSGDAPDIPTGTITPRSVRSFAEGRQVTESNSSNNRIASETASGAESALAGDAGTGRFAQSLQGHTIEEWRRNTEDLARYSARELGDTNSIGYHIQVWNHARKHDRLNGGRAVLTDGVFDILRELCERRAQLSTHPAQGKAWTRRTRKWFEDNGVPMLSKSEKEEAAEIRRALASTGFGDPAAPKGVPAGVAERGMTEADESHAQQASSELWDSMSREQKDRIDAQAEARLKRKMPFLFEDDGPKRGGAGYRAMLEAERRSILDAMRAGSR